MADRRRPLRVMGHVPDAETEDSFGAVRIDHPGRAVSPRAPSVKPESRGAQQGARRARTAAGSLGPCPTTLLSWSVWRDGSVPHARSSRWSEQGRRPSGSCWVPAHQIDEGMNQIQRLVSQKRLLWD